MLKNDTLKNGTSCMESAPPPGYNRDIVYFRINNLLINKTLRNATDFLYNNSVYSINKLQCTPLMSHVANNSHKFAYFYHQQINYSPPSHSPQHRVSQKICYYPGNSTLLFSI